MNHMNTEIHIHNKKKKKRKWINGSQGQPEDYNLLQHTDVEEGGTPLPGLLHLTLIFTL